MNTRTQMKTAARRNWQLATAVSAILLSSALPQQAAAQSANAALRGKAPASSEVKVVNTETGLTRSAQVGSDGNYVLVGLPPGTYRVSGGGNEYVVTLGVASTATLDFEAADPTALGEVRVSGARLREVKTSEVGTGISLRQIEVAPQITRNFLEFADAVPGMQFSVDAKGRTQVRSGALGTGTTNVYIDGVGQKNYVRPSGASGQAGVDSNPRSGANQSTVGSSGNPFPQLAIAEYKVITSNYKAEYDQVSGAAITAVTKSGTNEFEASVFMSYTDASLRSKTPAEIAAGTGKEGGDSEEYGFSLGGPIIKDKLHFFLTYERKDFTTPNTVQAPQLFDEGNVEQDWVGALTPELRANYGPVANPFDEDLIFAKLDWEVGYSDRLELSVRSREERQQTGAAGVVAESAATTYVNDDQRLALRWEHISDRYFNEVTFTYEDTEDSPSKVGSEAGKRFVAQGTLGAGFDVILQTDGVDPLGYFFASQSGYGLQDDITFTDFSWHGEHTFKAGVKFKDVELEMSDASTEALYSFYVQHETPNAGVEADPFEVLFGAQADPSINATAVSKNKQYGIYLQDDWVVNDKLVLNIGVRYDYEETPTYTDYETPQRFIDAIFAPDTNGCFGPDPPDAGNCPNFFFGGAYHGAQPGDTYADTLANGGININDYISTGGNRSNDSDNIAPRFGFSYDLLGDQEHVIFGGAARSYDRNTFSVLQLESNKATLYTPTVQFWNASNAGCEGPVDASATCIEWNDAYFTPDGLASIAPDSFGEMHFMNNDLETPYADQFTLGMRNRWGSWNTSAAVAYIKSYKGIIASSGNRFGDGTWYWYDTFRYAPGEAPVPNAGGGSLFFFDNAESTRSTQLLLSADKPYSTESPWSVSLAYTYTHAKVRDFPGDYQFQYASPYYSLYVVSDQVAKNRLVAIGTMDLPWGMLGGAKFVIESPKAQTGFNGIGTSPGRTDPANGLNYNYFKLSQFPDKDIGYMALDLQLTKSFEMPNGSAIQFRLDALNVTNHKNYVQYINTFPGPPDYFKDGDISGVPRTFKFSVNFNW